MTLSSYSRIFALGSPPVRSIFSDEVEVTEKVDGSQFVFGVADGELKLRSKGAELFVEAPNKQFAAGINYAAELFANGRLPNNVVFYCEYLQKPKHNALTYNRIPKNHLALYAVSDIGDTHAGSRRYVSEHMKLHVWADLLDIDVVPLVYHGVLSTSDQVLSFLDRESFLGGPKIEGVVIKNYNKAFLDRGQEPCSVMSAKLVSEAFKEVHRHDWKPNQTTRGKWDAFKEGYRTEARWEKAVQHLRDAGVLTESPKDIGALIKEVRKDIVEEEFEIIRQFLWQEFSDELLRCAIAGLPEWYKERLVTDSMDAAA
jgi:hypothetical protein